MSHEILNALTEVKNSTLERLTSTQDSAQLETIRIDVLGRNGSLTALSKQMGSLPNELKPKAGAAFHATKNEIQMAFEATNERLSATTEKEIKNAIDVTLPPRMPQIGHMHPISQVMDECVDIFRRMGFVVAEGPEIEDVYHIFDALNTPADHPTRDPKDTFYFNDGRLLRTQTSGVQVRVMEKTQPPIRIISPGRTYRRDTPDATHSMNFHQIEGLYVAEKVSLADLKSTLLHFAKELLGSDAKIRMRPHFFPFTEPSVEVDFSCIMCGGSGCRICKQSGYLEIMGAGMVDPNVFKTVGIDPEKYTGFAFGMGLERIAMLRYKINDIRFLYENDVRFLEQF